MVNVRNGVLMTIAAALSVASGCAPYSMGIFTPIPSPPWVTERMEEKYCHPNDFRTPVLPPLQPGYPPPLCEDPPDKAAVIRVLPRVTRGVPYFYEEFRDDIDVISERQVDKIDPPRFFPVVGWAQLHHCHWKCTVFYNETKETSYPFPFRCQRPRIQVVYVDKDHLHPVPCGTPETVRSFSRDLAGSSGN